MSQQTCFTMATMRSRVPIVLLIGLATGISSSTQQSETGIISGHVVDETGAAIGGASVFVHSRSVLPNEMKLEAHTDGDGQFYINLPAGPYDVLIVSTGFLAEGRTLVVSASKTLQIVSKLKAVPCNFPGMNCDNFFR